MFSSPARMRRHNIATGVVVVVDDVVGADLMVS
jgi:hypothetical protein